VTFKINPNTLILAIALPLFAWAGKEGYKEIKLTHDAVLTIQIKMVPRSEFDVQMSEMRTRISAVEVEIEKLKIRKL